MERLKIRYHVIQHFKRNRVWVGWICIFGKDLIQLGTELGNDLPDLVDRHVRRLGVQKWYHCICISWCHTQKGLLGLTFMKPPKLEHDVGFQVIAKLLHQRQQDRL